MSDFELYKLYPSTNATKKYDIYVINPATGNRKKVSFGAAGMSDYTIHKDKERRERYRIRHANDRIHDPTSPGFWSWHVLWGDSSSLKKALADTLKKYHLK